jgi:DNA-directed RNA polymerase I subunit RPA2
MLRFSWRKQEYVVPIMLLLKALVGASDKEVFEGVVMQDYENTFLIDRAELLLRSYKISLHSSDRCLDYLGDKFRVVLGLPEDWTNLDVGTWLVRKLVLVHLQAPRDKFRMLLYAAGPFDVQWPRTHSVNRFMLRKLYAIVSKTCSVDNPDSPQHQEVLLPGSLYGMIIKEKLEEALNQVRNQIIQDVRKQETSVDFLDGKEMVLL